MKEEVYFEIATPFHCEKCYGDITISVFKDYLLEFDYFICDRCKTKYSTHEYEVVDGIVIKK